MNIRTSAIALSTVIALTATAAFAAETMPATTPHTAKEVVKETVKTEATTEAKTDATGVVKEVTKDATTTHAVEKKIDAVKAAKPEVK
jgi:hypothetical protein